MATSPSSSSVEYFGYPGCVPTISANGTSNGIAWALDQAGVLRAYDASNLLTELYNSNQNATRDALGQAVKFSVPMVVNGKVYAGTQNSLVAYGLLAPGSGALAVSNAASGNATAIAPGSIVSIYGSGLANSTATAGSFPLPANLGGATVTVGGENAPLLYASPTQLNAQVPFDIPAGTASLSVSVGGSLIGTGSLTISAAAPGLFLEGQNAAAVLNQDGSLNSSSHPAPVGSYIAAFLTGLGPVNPPVAAGVAAPVTPLSNATFGATATIGAATAPVQFAGLAPGFAGLYQVNVQVPALSAGQYPLQVSVNGVLSNAATVSVQ